MKDDDRIKSISATEGQPPFLPHPPLGKEDLRALN